MQEEVEQRIVSLMISCGKLGEQEFRKAEIGRASCRERVSSPV